MDELFRAYLTDWLEWVERGAPELQPYSRRYGLCTNASIYDRALSRPITGLICDALGIQMTGHPIISYEEYWDRAEAFTQHESPKRLAWVRNFLNKE